MQELEGKAVLEKLKLKKEKGVVLDFDALNQSVYCVINVMTWRL